MQHKLQILETSVERIGKQRNEQEQQLQNKRYVRR